MDVSLRLHNGIVHIPTSYRSGFLIDDAPIESVPAEQTERLRHAIFVAIERGNPPISRNEANTLVGRKDHPLLKAARVRSWYALDRQTKGLWSVAENGGFYQIRVDEPMQPRGWHEDKSKRIEFPAGTRVEDVIDRLIAMIQECARQ